MTDPQADLRSSELARRVPHVEPLYTRRDILMRGGAGFGALPLAWLLSQDSARGATQAAVKSQLAAKAAHFAPCAKSVIFLFMEGGPSHIDLFDPKPLLNELAGQSLPESFGTVITAMGELRRRCWPANATGSNTARAARGFPTGCRRPRQWSTTSP